MIKDFKTFTGSVTLKIDKERDVITEEALVFIKDEAVIYTKLKKLSKQLQTIHTEASTVLTQMSSCLTELRVHSKVFNEKLKPFNSNVLHNHL